MKFFFSNMSVINSSSVDNVFDFDNLVSTATCLHDAIWMLQSHETSTQIIGLCGSYLETTLESIERSLCLWASWPGILR